MRGMEKESIWKGVVEMAMTEKSKVDRYIYHTGMYNTIRSL